ncbi:MAG: acyl carrier protein [Bacteroidales bacterium]|nr:acyl carrier protein [Bacteroidales bacterium]
MDIESFIEKFAKAIDVENVEELTPETEFHDLDEWSSLSVILVIAFFDMEFGKQIDNIAIREADTILDLYNLAIA